MSSEPPLRPTGMRPTQWTELLGLLPGAQLVAPGALGATVAGGAAVAPGATVAGGAAVAGATAPGAAAVTGVTHDSRSVRLGDLYAALPGARVHGADFAAEAVAAGAAAVLTDPGGAARAAATGVPVFVVPDPRAVLGRVAAGIYGRPAAGLLLIGVTGTNGKTTTSYFIEAGLRRAGHRTGLLGTVETRIAGEVVPSVRTTPEAPDLQALLAVMRERRVDAVAMEVSSHALALGRVDGMAFDVAVFTNLTPDHLDFHPTMEDYYAAKASLFTSARAGRGVVNVDDAHGARLAAESEIPVETVSPAGKAADWRVVDVEPSPSGSTGFRLVGPAGESVRALIRLPGAFNVANAALALVALAAGGVPLELGVRGVGGPVPGRMEKVWLGQPFVAVVDYAHSPDAVERALAALRPATTGRLLVVLGAGGDRDRRKRPAMGEAAARGADLVIVTDDNPRSEDPAAIRAAVLAGARGGPAETLEVADRRAAIEDAVRRAGPGDTLLVAGKGHEIGQEIDGVVTPFDDRVVLAEAIEAALR